MPQKPRQESSSEFVCLLGLGLDQTDDHRRLTAGDNFLLLGGSNETHERMIETAIHLNEELGRRGKSLHNTSHDELIEIVLERLHR